MGRPHSYSTDQRAKALAALAANDGNLSRTAKQLSIPRNTLRLWMEEQKVRAGSEKKPTPKAIADTVEKAVVSVLQKHYEQDLAEAFDRVAHACLDLTEEEIRTASVRDRIAAAATAADRRQLLRGKATAIMGQEMTDDERLRNLRELAERARRRRLGLSDTGRTGEVGPIAGVIGEVS
jgi:transposase-like protein